MTSLLKSLHEDYEDAHERQFIRKLKLAQKGVSYEVTPFRRVYPYFIDEEIENSQKAMREHHADRWGGGDGWVYCSEGNEST